MNEGKPVALRLALGNDHLQPCVQPGRLHCDGDNDQMRGREMDTAFLARRTVGGLQQWTHGCHYSATEMIWDRCGTGGWGSIPKILREIQIGIFKMNDGWISAAWTTRNGNAVCAPELEPHP
jgi:hypothetical protein